MKPTGSASRKNARSSGLSEGPAQPKMTALGSGFGKKAPDAALAKLRAEPFGLGRVGDRTHVNAIEHAAIAQVDAIDRDRERAHEIAVLPFDAIPCLLRNLRRLHRAELETIASDRSSGAGRGRGRDLGRW